MDKKEQLEAILVNMIEAAFGYAFTMEKDDEAIKEAADKILELFT